MPESDGYSGNLLARDSLYANREFYHYLRGAYSGKERLDLCDDAWTEVTL